MERIKLAVGTISEQKIGYLKEILSEIGIEADLFPVKVESRVSEQPLSNDETRDGSVNRAKNALEAIIPADCAVGVEVGYHKNDSGKYEIFCWATIVDREGIIVSKRSHEFVMPEFHQDKLRNGLLLGDYVRSYLPNSNNPATQHISEMIINRKTFIVKSLEHSLICYFGREEF